ncbi:META domain-containing protein [Sphingomonas sp. A2-49]|uniref:META domain-containing protein n=1 Tax=Sphingomonas sp. A2-49 TaxID=1391375 RepID=UPI0021D31415|nr:META domain-containing protein [Sphingomonas sp. A2-49]MCU6455389.1 META domain-containing protein [Sphingomonas sp. A2-49]
MLAITMAILLSTAIGGRDPATSGTYPANMADRIWVLHHFDNVSVSDPNAATLTFRRDGGVEGTVCNNRGSSGWWSWSARRSGREGAITYRPDDPGKLTLYTLIGCRIPGSGTIGGDFWQKMRSATS